MEDNQIIALYWNRNQSAIKETDKKYGKYCKAIAYNILQNKENSEECINDTYLKVWNSIPDESPKIFKAFISKITRNLALDKYKKISAKKRNIRMEVILDELDECIPSQNSVESEVQYKDLVNYLNEFLEKLPENKRDIFIDRYWYLEDLKEISKKNKTKVNNIKVILYRLRENLKDYLTERGVNI